MDFSLLFFGLFALVYLGAMLYLANMQELARFKPQLAPVDKARQQSETALRWMLYGIAGIMFVMGLLILQVAALPVESVPADLQIPAIDINAALVNFFIAAAAAYLSVRLVISQPLRHVVRRLTGTNSTYTAESYVHVTAMVLALAMVTITIGQAVSSGGMTGLAQNIEASDISPGQMAFQTALFIALALLGVGVAIRRTWPQTLNRMGLRLPTTADITWGIGAGTLLYFTEIILVMIWFSISSPELIAEQSAASAQFANLFDTLPLALALSLSSAVSEEILFRGALQPVFGLGLTSLFFALVHIQYTFTPITGIIFIVALGLGWLRQRQSTSAAIIAHFIYNFVQLALAILFAGAF
jgi:membrane protease YdiL (CAAX protease family)